MEEAQDAPPAPARFDLALSLAGGVSAGSWTAGVLDFIVEALDAWEAAAAARSPDAPPHRLVISGLAGASAGAQAGALLTMALARRFPHVRLGGDEPPPAQALKDNVLYAGWVDGATAAKLLDVSDRSDQVFKSLLDGSCTDEVAARALDTAAQLPAFAPPRRWLADPLRVSMAVTNLEGVPLEVKTQTPQPLRSFRLHADTLRFAVSGVGGTPARPARHDEVVLGAPPLGCTDKDWQCFAQVAAASGALPGLLPERRVDWPRAAYEPVRLPLPAGLVSPPTFMPLWTKPQKDAPSTVAFTGADGGVLDNGPVDLAQDTLPPHEKADDGKKPRVNAAVLIVHPLLGLPQREPPPDAGLVGARLHRLLGALAQAVWNHARISPQDVMLALDEQHYTRFMIAPARPDDPLHPDATALAGSSLGAFGGYLDAAYREHDYQLGRANAQWALRYHLTLPACDPLFEGWSEDQCKDLAVDGAAGCELPLIPLMPALRDAPEPTLRWPSGLDPTRDLEPPLERRIDAVARGLLRSYLPHCPVGRWLLRLVWRLAFARRLRKYLLAQARQGLKDHGL